MGHPRLFSVFDEKLWQSLSEGALQLQCCSDCGHWRYPPGAACPECLSIKADWRKVSGEAKLLSWTTFHRQYLPGWPAPYTCVAGQLAEGPILVAPIDAEAVPKLRLDLPLRLTYGPHAEGYQIFRFTLAPEAEGGEATEAEAGSKDPAARHD